MAEIGQGGRALVPAARAPAGAAVAFAFVVALAAAAGCAWMWGFTVDDALIPVRYARHLAAGQGYRFNVAGPSTDGVTPLPWAFVEAPLVASAGSALDALMRVKYMSAIAWIAAAWTFGLVAARAAGGPRRAAGSALALAVSVPVMAHAVSGLETGVATATATLAAVALVEGRWRAGAGVAGLACALRPELLPWALAAATFAAPPRARARAVAGALAAAPFAACALARVIAFGRPAPLALWAKPGDATQGAMYAVAGALVAATPLLVVAPVALLARGEAEDGGGGAEAGRMRAARALAAAAVAHVAAVAVAGGDWMPYARLFAPIAPACALVDAVLAGRAARPPGAGAGPGAGRWRAVVGWRGWLTARRAAATALGAWVLVKASPAGRHVLADRVALAEAARPYLAPARAVATLDVGWPTLVTEATMVDLGGVTDPEIAARPGGHTSKRVDAEMLLERGVDVVLLETYGPSAPDTFSRAAFGRTLEARLASSPLVTERFLPAAWLPLGSTGRGYFVLTRR